MTNQAPPPHAAQTIESEPQSRSITASLVLSWLVAFVLLALLVYFGGVWNILANTRILGLFIDGGIIQYTDMDAGFIEGVADPEYYLNSQDPIDWAVVAIAIGLFFLFWAVKTLQFHDIAQYHGLTSSYRENASTYFHGLLYERTTPFGLADGAVAAELQANQAPAESAYSTVFLFRAFVLLEILVFALYGLFAVGWAAWLVQVFGALFILGLAYWWSRSTPVAAPRLRYWSAIGTHIRNLARFPKRLVRISLLSIVAFGLEDIAAYLLAMAFTSEHVILNVDFSVLLMAIVASYIARLVRFTPGGLGQFEWGFALALYVGGLGMPEAVTIAILDTTFRYFSLFLIYLVMLFSRGSKTSYEEAKAATFNPPSAQAASTPVVVVNPDQLPEIPTVVTPKIPNNDLVWSRLAAMGWFGLIIYWDYLTILLADYWLFERLDIVSVFWRNFNMGATLFGVGFVAFAAALIIPALVYPLAAAGRSFVIQLAIQVGLLAGTTFSWHYLEYLVFNGGEFNQLDPIFGNDIGFYVFSLPVINITVEVILWAFVTLLVSSIICLQFIPQIESESRSRVLRWLGHLATPLTGVALGGIGISIAAMVWLSRFQLLYKDNSASAIPTGAEYLDVVGLFSTLNYRYLTAIVIVIGTVLLLMLLGAIKGRLRQGNVPMWAGNVRLMGQLLILLMVVDFAFAGAIYARDVLFIRPNEPVVQLPYIDHHLQATRNAYHLTDIELIDFLPNDIGDEVPTLDELLASPTMKNAPLWPPYTSYLEPLLDPQHAERIIQTNGDPMVYGPTLEIFRQQQQLRSYYDFLSVDPLRYTLDGEPQVLVSSVREIPLIEPQMWLTWWGQRFILYTHGYGLVMAPMGQATPQGEPVFVSQEIPIQTAYDELALEKPQVFYGEGAVSMAINNIKGVKAFDYPTEQGRAEITLDEQIGVNLDSLLKRVVFGWRSGQFFEIVFSDLITPETQLHYFRTPLDRLERVAPFLYLDSNAYAFPVDGEVVWLVNGMGTTDMYPYSKHETIGDKSVSRFFLPIDMEPVNYVEDAVKATVNARTGEVTLYALSDEPIGQAWRNIYPELFTPGDAMPAEVRQQLTYPLQLFHIQFDDVYNIYQMDEAIYFFNMEDAWDDGDEVLGPIMDVGKSINFSIEPYNLILETGGLLPETEAGSQFSQLAVFTPENALNLRAVPIVYQDGDDYGKLMVLRVPKGQYVIGPEQADAAIDQDPDISRQFALWNRRGTEVIRGHTSLMIVGNELLYMEPVFLRSQQNPVTQLKQVIIVFRGKPYMADTLEAALQTALADQAARQPVASN